jgi:hypothetical protein
MVEKSLRWKKSFILGTLPEKGWMKAWERKAKVKKQRTG